MFYQLQLMILLRITHVFGTSAEGIIISPSTEYTTFENNPPTFTFNCSGNGTGLIWTVDGYTTGTSYVSNKGISYTFPLSTDGLTVSSQLIVPTTKANNNTVVICTVLDKSYNHQSSDPVRLILQGILAAPYNFSVAMSNTTFVFSWGAPYSLDVTDCSPDIFYYTLCTNITIYGCKNISSDPDCTFPRKCTTSLDFNGVLINDPQNITTLPNGGLIKFTIFAVNGAGNGNATTATYVGTQRTETACTIVFIDGLTTSPIGHYKIVYGAICGTSAVLISMVIVMVCVGVYIRCKHKGNIKSTQIELEQNNAYEVINKLSCPLDEKSMEPCPAYGEVL